eukprot:5189497-Amphidinium_carterae.2
MSEPRTNRTKCSFNSKTCTCSSISISSSEPGASQAVHLAPLAHAWAPSAVAPSPAVVAVVVLLVVVVEGFA